MAIETEKEVVAAAPPMSAEPKKTTKAKVVKTKPTHPTWAIMIEAAIKEMNEKGGSSIPAIKKFILSHNDTVDKVRLTSHMRRAVNTLTNNGTLIQAKGHGLTGSFKLRMMKANKKAPVEPIEKKTAKKEAAPKTKEPRKKPAMMVAKAPGKPKVKATKKTAAPKAKKPAAKKAAKPKAEKKIAPKPKVNKTAKKPKSPKPKTIKKVAAKPKAKSAAPK